MLEIISLVTIIFLALLAVRSGTIALQRTGLSRDAAGFQAQSAFMGVGFTTAEAESVVRHPVRRRIIRALMWGGFTGITATVSTAVLAFAVGQGDNELSPGEKAAWLVVFLLALLLAWRLKPLSRLVDAAISRALNNIRELRVLDFEELLQLDRGYAVATLPVEEGHWIAGHTLRGLRLADEGVLVLSITRESGVTIGTPGPDIELHAGDRVVCYGRQDSLERLVTRPADALGDRQRKLAVEEQRAREVEEKVAAERSEEGQGEPSAP